MIELLRDDHDIYVIAPQSLLDVDIMSRTRHLYTGIPIKWNQEEPRWRRALQMPGKYREIRRIIDQVQPSCTLFNSTYTQLDVILIAYFLRGVHKAQNIVEFGVFLTPGMRWFYKQFAGNVVISEEMRNYVVSHHPEFGSLDYFLPIFFDGFEATCRAAAAPAASVSTCLQIAVFGGVDQARRNHKGLFESLASWYRPGSSPGFVLHLVGKLPVEYQEFIKAHDLEDVVLYYDAFVSFEEMFRVLRSVDIVLFLVDGTVGDAWLYNRYKTPGVSSLIKGFHKACAASREFKVDESLADKCFFYEGSRVEDFFESIANGSVSRTIVREMESRYEGVALFSREEQKKRLVRALRLGPP